jgi:hypothetical protein
MVMARMVGGTFMGGSSAIGIAASRVVLRARLWSGSFGAYGHFTKIVTGRRRKLAVGGIRG